MKFNSKSSRHLIGFTKICNLTYSHYVAKNLASLIDPHIFDNAFGLTVGCALRSMQHAGKQAARPINVDIVHDIPEAPQSAGVPRNCTSGIGQGVPKGGAHDLPPPAQPAVYP